VVLYFISFILLLISNEQNSLDDDRALSLYIIQLGKRGRRRIAQIFGVWEFYFSFPIEDYYYIGFLIFRPESICEQVHVYGLILTQEPALRVFRLCVCLEKTFLSSRKKCAPFGGSNLHPNE